MGTFERYIGLRSLARSRTRIRVRYYSVHRESGEIKEAEKSEDSARVGARGVRTIKESEKSA